MSLQWRGKFLEVHRDGTWEYAARTRSIGAAVILALTDAREIVLVVAGGRDRGHAAETSAASPTSVPSGRMASDR